MTCRNNHKADDHEKLDLKIRAEEDPDGMANHQVKRHQMFKDWAIHKVQDQATRRRVAIDTVGLLDCYQEEQNTKFCKN
jgi:hypothetical protein